MQLFGNCGLLQQFLGDWPADINNHCCHCEEAERTFCSSWYTPSTCKWQRPTIFQSRIQKNCDRMGCRTPGHQQANGKAKTAVNTAKRIIGRAIKSKQDPYLAILEYCNIPSQNTVRPTQRMFGRMTRTMLPVQSNLLSPKDSALIKQNQKLRDSRKAWYYNQHARDLDHLAEGQTVRMRPLVNNMKYLSK